MLRYTALALSIGALVVALSYAPFASAGSPAGIVAAQVDPQQRDHATPSGQSQAAVPDMMKMHQQMMADMRAADARLDELVKAMNAATGEARLSAIVQAVNELAAQQRGMHAHMGMMHQHMGMMPMEGRGMMKK